MQRESLKIRRAKEICFFYIIKYTKTVFSDKVKRIVALGFLNTFYFLKKIIMT